MSSYAVRNLLVEVRKLAESERAEAAADRNLNLLQRYPEHLWLVQRLLGDADDALENRNRVELFRPEDLTGIVQQVRQALAEVVSGSAATQAAAEIAQHCIDNLPASHKDNLRRASEDAAEVAIKDAVLAGVSLWLHDQAVSRKPIDRRKREAGWSPGSVQTASEATRRQHANRRPDGEE